MTQRVLDQRYELQEKIGGGGMADVYKAMDLVLGRTVAVKVLHEQFKSDQEFITKFQREAQAAAQLSHPNIVNIYDVGASEGDHYIVMEYVPGSTLKDLIKQQGHLPVAEALRIAGEIASALAHAHMHGLVHCDIKPHNILMMPDGTAKVADFGIARAVTESTMTYSGNVVGSVHYFSPEQARGTLITPKSDVYSLGVVLYEMLTGQLPFTGATPVSIAMKHLQEEPVPVRQLDPSIPPVAEAVVSRAMSKDPEQRPDSAEMVQDIQQAEQMLQGRQNFSAADDPYATRVMPAVHPDEPLPSRRQRDAYAPEVDEPQKSVFKSKKFVIGLILILCMGFFVGAFMSYGEFWSTSEIEVPNVTGQQLTVAKQLLESKKLRVSVQEVNDADTPAGEVISQDPEAGAKVKEKRVVTLKVSKGGQQIEMPDVRGLSKADAIARLEKVGLKVNVYEKSSDEEAGTVIDSDPRPGKKVAKGSSVEIYVSKGKKAHKSEVPDVVGMDVNNAKTVLQARGFRVSVTQKAVSGAQAGTVVSQSVSGTAEEGTTVTITVAESSSQREDKKDKNKQENKQDSNHTQVPVPGVENGKGK